MKSWTEIRLSSLDFCINLNYTTLTSDIKKQQICHSFFLVKKEEMLRSLRRLYFCNNF